MYNLVELIDRLTEHLGQTSEEFMSRLYSEGITPRLMDYICMIHAMRNPSFGDLARGMKLSKPSVTASVEKLEKMGYLRRVRSDEDRRSSHLHLTERGTALVELHDRTHRANAEMVERALAPGERDELVRILNKVVAGFDR
jgi:DNA-binding MarR family transcriptional regulator